MLYRGADMRILIVSDNFPPERNAPASRIFAHAKEWLKAGSKVSVLTCAPNFPAGKVFPGYSNKLFFRENIQGIDVIRVWSFIWPNRGIFLRLLDFISFAKSASIAGLFVSFDVVLTTSPQFFVNFAGYFLSLVKRKPWILEVRDLWPESVGSVGVVKKKGLLKPFEWLELFFYRKAQVIVVVTDGIRQSLLRRGVPSEKIVFAPNGADRSIFSGPQGKVKTDSSKLSVVYAGTFGAAHALDFVLKSLKHLEMTNSKLAHRFHWKFIGDGAERQNLLNLAAVLELSTVEILPAMDRAELVNIYRESDWALVNLRKADTFLGALPSKMFELSAMGIPILMGVRGEAQVVLERFQAGLLFEPESLESFELALEKIVRCAESDYQKMVNGGLDLAKYYSRERIAADLLSDIRMKLGASALLTDQSS